MCVFSLYGQEPADGAVTATKSDSMWVERKKKTKEGRKKLVDLRRKENETRAEITQPVSFFLQAAKKSSLPASEMFKQEAVSNLTARTLLQDVNRRLLSTVAHRCKSAYSLTHMCTQAFPSPDGVGTPPHLNMHSASLPACCPNPLPPCLYQLS